MLLYFEDNAYRIYYVYYKRTIHNHPSSRYVNNPWMYLGPHQNI